MANSLLGSASLSTYEPTFREKAADWLRGLLYSDDREGQRKAERLLGVLETATPVGVATGLDDMREAVGQGDYATAGMMGAMAMVPGPNPKIKAYHSSPHSFDRFSMDKIGTGEGAQAYGHGLYFAESPDVSGHGGTYWMQFANKMSQEKTPEGIATFALKTAKGDKDEAVKYLQYLMTKSSPNSVISKSGEDALALLQGGKHVGPHTYEVEINASPDDFLDWDKPLSEQPGIKQKLLSPGGLIGDIENNQYAADFLEPFVNGEYDSLTGRELVGMLERLGQNEYLPVNGPNVSQYLDSGHTPPAVSNVLRNEGIPGIKYLDAGSRPPQYGPDVQYLLKEFGSKERALEVAKQRLASARSPREQIKAQEAVDALSIPETRNYVVFDENLINIVRKYGIAGASAMLGYNLLDGASPAEAAQLKNIELTSRPLLGGGGW